jgi:hypothetical protein
MEGAHPAGRRRASNRVEADEVACTGRALQGVGEVLELARWELLSHVDRRVAVERHGLEEGAARLGAAMSMRFLLATKASKSSRATFA